MNLLKIEAEKTLQFLEDEGLLTDADALNVALVQALCDEWPEATSSTQRAALSKELRACLESLPKPEPVASDELGDLLTDLASD